MIVINMLSRCRVEYKGALLVNIAAVESNAVFELYFALKYLIVKDYFDK